MHRGDMAIKKLDTLNFWVYTKWINGTGPALR